MNPESRTETDALRKTLLDAVPPLPAPPVRLAEVGARVRRARTRTVAAAAISVALVLAGLGVLGLSREARRRTREREAASMRTETENGANWQELRELLERKQRRI